MAYDRADWHYGGEYPDDLPPENGATHIGMYLGWALKRGLAGELHLEESQEALEQVRDGTLSGRDFLMEQCDEKFTDEDLNDEGNRFTADYYDDHYFDDYTSCLDDDSPCIYRTANSPKNQARVEAALDERFDAWRRRHGEPSKTPDSAPAKKPWWRFW